MSTVFVEALGLYSIMTGKLHLYVDEMEVENVLLWRDEIQEELDSGLVPTNEQLRLLKDADDRLLGQRERLVRDFPRAFRGADKISRRMWWWHLREGPDVREKAKDAA